MRLSEAIRLGSLLGPQLKDGWLIGPGNASCAMGAALLALGVHYTEVQIESFDTTREAIKEAMQVQSQLNDLLPKYFPGLQAAVPPLTLDGLPLRVTSLCAISLHTCLWQMNDRTLLTREQIADWLVSKGLDCESVDLRPQEKQHECQDSLVTA